MLGSDLQLFVVGPEGSGTNLLTDVVAEIVGWPRSDPSALQIRNAQSLEPGRVHHISLPSHRPEVWIDVRKRWLKDVIVVGMSREMADCVYSAWRRFGKMPASTGDLRAYVRNCQWAHAITQEISKLVVRYEALCTNPDGEIARLCHVLGVPSRTAQEIGIPLQSQNGKYRGDFQFLRQLEVHTDLLVN